MSVRRTYRVKEVAELSGVSVRALHHYDAIGLLKPSRRSPSGYRTYTKEDLLRLQQVLVGRELGMSLDEIRCSLDDPDFDLRAALERQRSALRQRSEETARMIRAIDRALTLLEGAEGTGFAEVLRPAPGNSLRKGEAVMTVEDLFDGFEPKRYEWEAEQRWGHTEAYRESAKRVQRYSAEDWERVKAEQSQIYIEACELLKQGEEPGSLAAVDVAERHRQSITRWFYPCSHAMHASLADLYENDARFAQNIDRYGSGLTEFLVTAIRANASRHGASAFPNEGDGS